MALVYHRFKLDVTPGAMPPELNVSEQDINRQIEITLMDGGEEFAIPSGTTATIEGTIGDHGFRANAASATGCVVTFLLTEDMTACEGRAWVKVKLTKDNAPVSTCGFWLVVDRAGVNANTVIGMSGFEQQLKDGVYDYLDDHQLASIAFLPQDLVSAGTDINTIVRPGCYLLAGAASFAYVNNPLPSGHTGILLVYEASERYGMQMIYDMVSTKAIYKRIRRESTDFSGQAFVQILDSYYTPTSTPFSVITDMPTGSTYIGQPNTFTLGDNFHWTLQNNVSYRIVKFNMLILVSSPASNETYIGSYSNVGVDSWIKLAEDEEPTQEDDAVQIYTEFNFIPGKVYSGNSMIDKPSDVNLQATEKMPCLGNTDYFNRFRNYTYNGTTVVFFDKTGQIIGHKWQSEFAEYSYTTPDGTQEFDGTYLPMLKFTTPENAAFFAFNWSMTEANKKYFCVSNVPLFLIGFSQPNIRIKANSPLLAKKDKTLCVIGPSGVMIDRLNRPAAGDYISGFQEHLRPHYKDVVSYGYSSAAYAVGATESPSIYEYITQGVGSLPAKDFTNIDEVLLIQSGTALSTLQVGDAGGLTAETVDPSTMIGAIRGIVQYILVQNPRCKIYVASFYKYNNSIANPNKVYEMHEAVRALCDALGLTYIDLWSNVPFNYSNYSAENLIYTYDGGHANSAGNAALADVIKRHLIG